MTFYVFLSELPHTFSRTLRPVTAQSVQYICNFFNSRLKTYFLSIYLSIFIRSDDVQQYDKLSTVRHEQDW